MSVCYQCPNRHPKCHSESEKYIAENAHNAIIREKRHDMKWLDFYNYETSIRLKKQRRIRND